MKYQTRQNGQFVDDPFWEEMPVIQRGDSLFVEPASEPLSTPIVPPIAKLLPADAAEEPAPQPEPEPAALPLPPEPLIRLADATINDTVAHDEPCAEPAAEPVPKITPVEAMRQALTTLGLDAGNAALAAYVRDQFGLMLNNVSELKSRVKRTLVQSDEVEPIVLPPLLMVNGRAVAVGPVAPQQEQAAPVAAAVDEEITYTFEDVVLVKGLCDRLGLANLLALIDVLE